MIHQTSVYCMKTMVRVFDHLAFVLISAETLAIVDSNKLTTTLPTLMSGNGTNDSFSTVCASSVHVSSTSSGKSIFPEYVERAMKICRIVEIITYGCISIVGFIGNVLVLIISTKNQNMKTINNFMISLLAVSDMTFMFLVGPSVPIERAIPRYPFSNFFCILSNYVLYTLLFISINFMCLMSVERFLAIVFPIKSIAFRTKTHLRISCVICVIMAGVVSIPALFMFGVGERYMNNECLLKCTMINGDQIVFGKVSLAMFFMGILNVFAFLLPLTILSVMYSCIFYKLTSMKRIRSTTRSHTRAAIIVLVMELVFLACWAPLQIFGFLIYFTSVTNNINYLTFSILNVVASALTFLSCCMNPILYTFVAKEYRKKLRELFFKPSSNDKTKSSTITESSDRKNSFDHLTKF